MKSHLRTLLAGLVVALSMIAFAGSAWAAAKLQASGTAQGTSSATTTTVPNGVTQGEILAMTKMVLDVSKEQSERAREHLTWLMGAIGAAVAALSFFGYREVKSIGAPYKEKLESLKVEYEEKLNVQITEFRERSHNNARALVASSRIWNLMEQTEKLPAGEGDAARAVLFDKIVDHVDKALPADYTKKLDPYLVGLLLMRKAFALKRLGRCADAFKASKGAIELDGDTSQAMWLYNAACYAALAKQENECFDLLQKAIQLDPKNRVDAETDTDFDGLRSSEDFIALIQAPA